MADAGRDRGNGVFYPPFSISPKHTHASIFPPPSFQLCLVLKPLTLLWHVA